MKGYQKMKFEMSASEVFFNHHPCSALAVPALQEQGTLTCSVRRDTGLKFREDTSEPEARPRLSYVHAHVVHEAGACLCIPPVITNVRNMCVHAHLCLRQCVRCRTSLRMWCPCVA